MTRGRRNKQCQMKVDMIMVSFYAFNPLPARKKRGEKKSKKGRLVGRRQWRPPTALLSRLFSLLFSTDFDVEQGYGVLLNRGGFPTWREDDGIFLERACNPASF